MFGKDAILSTSYIVTFATLTKKDPTLKQSRSSSVEIF